MNNTFGVRMTQKIVIAFILLTGLTKLGAQDTQFSQFYAAPLKLNPALTAFFDGNFRLGGVYRNQWSRAIQKPITSFAFNGDMRFIRKSVTNNNPDFWGGGVLFGADRANNFGLSSTNLAISAAYHKALDKSLNQYISAGLMIGVVQRNLNYGNIYFDDQFDGLSEFDLPTGEFLPGNNFGYGDFGVGVHYSITPFPTLKLALGGAIHHLLEPNTSFYAGSTNSGATIRDVPLARKYQAHIAATNIISEAFSYSPRLMYVVQGQHQQILAGVNLRYEILESNGRAFQLGMWVRPVREINKYNLAAAVLMFGMELDRLNIGLSYDANLGDVLNEFSGLGTFELSVRYIGEYQNDDFFCPEF